MKPHSFGTRTLSVEAESSENNGNWKRNLYPFLCNPLCRYKRIVQWPSLPLLPFFTKLTKEKCGGSDALWNEDGLNL